jgi:hypothetical protein
MTWNRKGLVDVRLAVALASALLIPGCGGGDGDDDDGVVVVGGPGGPSRAIITEQGWALDPLGILQIDVVISGSGNGTVEATVEWTFATNDVDIYVTAPACTTSQLALEQCPYKAKADSTTAKPERVSFSVSAGETHRFWVVNFGPQRESGTFQAVLSR